MRRTAAFGTAYVLALTALACGGVDDAPDEIDEPGADTAAPAAADTAAEAGLPEWFRVDNQARTVSLDVTAGMDDSNNHWNFNGGSNGNMTITVPQGYQVTVNFTNDDPNMVHSIGVEEAEGTWPATLTPSPVFEGAASSNPASMSDATLTGESETLTFTASQAGEYALVCYIPGHAASGMWVNFTVVAGEDAGVTGP